MYDELLISKLKTCLEHIETIETYFGNSASAESFYHKNNGANYDGSIMRLQALGERLKNIIKKYPFVEIDLNYPEIENVIRFRDFVSHHYELVEHETIFEICRYKIPVLKTAISRLIN
jgi:uncharacterized protein with HEPN domain